MTKKSAAGQFKKNPQEMPFNYTVHCYPDEAPAFERVTQKPASASRLGWISHVENRGPASYSINLGSDKGIHRFYVEVNESPHLDDLLMDLFDKYIGYELGDL